MTRIVVDASVLLKLFAPDDERHADRAVALLDDWEEGRVAFVAPELLGIEVVNVAARKWRLAAPALAELVRAIEDFDIDLRPVNLGQVAEWSAHGLTAYDAAYVSVAARDGITLLTDDDAIVRLAPDHALALATYPAA